MARYNPDKMAEEIAQKVLDEYVYEGKTLREWVRLIKALDAEDTSSDSVSAYPADLMEHRHSGLLEED